MSSNIFYLNYKPNESYRNSLPDKELSNYLIKTKSLERVEKVIKNEEKENEINEEKENQANDEKDRQANKEKERQINEEEERKAHVCFDSYNIGIPSGITHEEMANVLNRSHYANFLDLSNAFVDAEREYRVNAFALVAISGAESRWNKTERAHDGNNNITGMDVQSDFSIGTIYNSKYDCIMDLARQLRLYYLTPGACYYKGLSTSKVNIYYSADANWYKNIDQIGDELVFEYNRLYR